MHVQINWIRVEISVEVTERMRTQNTIYIYIVYFFWSHQINDKKFGSQESRKLSLLQVKVLASICCQQSINKET